MTRRQAPTLFDVGRDEMLEQPNLQNFVVPESRVLFVAGMLSAWTLGAERADKEDREWFAEVAREALDKANVRRRRNT